MFDQFRRLNNQRHRQIFRRVVLRPVTFSGKFPQRFTQLDQVFHVSLSGISNHARAMKGQIIDSSLVKP